MRKLLAQIAEQFGTPCYVYDLDAICQRAHTIRKAFAGRFRLNYAVKSNPNGMLLCALRGLIDGLDISSGGELKRSRAAGWDATLMSFTGPAKSPLELREAVTAGIGCIVVESVEEARQIDALAEACGVRQTLLVRIAPAKVLPGFGSRMSGKPSQFGIDEEDALGAVKAIADLSNVEVCGFHVYAGTQCLDGPTIAASYLSWIEMFRHLAAGVDLSPRTLIFGSGLGIPYHDQDKPVDLAAIAESVVPALDALRAESRFVDARMVLETGRFLVGEAGFYLTRIVRTKRSRGFEIRICDGGMNHHLAACGHMGSVLHRNYRMFKVDPAVADAPVTAYDIYGPLCTSIDTLARAVRLPELNVGDVIAICCSGAYGLTASPLRFISHEEPREIIVQTVNGKHQSSDASEKEESGVVR